ncbi:hypothetical protein AB0A77_30815 [Streptomyces varsoviensis]
MAPVTVEITERPLTEAASEDGVEFVDDLDTLAGNEVMRGCGNDNPY